MKKKIAIVIASATGLAVLLACAALVKWEDPEGDLPAVSAIRKEPEVPTEWNDPFDIIGPSEPRIYYQYLDQSGAVRFAETLDEVPEAWRDRAGLVELDVPPPDTRVEGRMVRKLRQVREAAQTEQGTAR